MASDMSEKKAPLIKYQVQNPTEMRKIIREGVHQFFFPLFYIDFVY